MLFLRPTTIVIIASFMCVCVNGAKVLFVSFQQPSHVISRIGIGINLINRGHEVYYVLASDYPYVKDIHKAGIRVIHYKTSPDVKYPYTADYQNELAEAIYTRQLSELELVFSVTEHDCEAMMADENFLNLVKSMKFDLVVVEPFIVNPCHIIVPHYLGIPYVSVAAGFFPVSVRLPALPSFYQSVIVGPQLIDYPQLRSLTDRLRSSVNFFALWTFLNLKMWGDTTLLQKYAPEVESWEQLVLRSELILMENDHYLNSVMPLLPHVITVAGCTIQPASPLPEELEAIMRGSGDYGVILVSFGSAAYQMPSFIAMKFLTAFGRLKETVLTRMAVPNGAEIPSNVHMTSWLPQNDILGHNKTKLFITHSGSNSQYEALYHAVPMLGIPMFAEQGWNCARAKNKGISLCLDLLEFTPDQLHDSIRLLIDNSTYLTTVRKMSAIFRDEPLSGSEKAGHWINHVIKYGGSHLRTPALDQNSYQLFMIDVIVVFVLLMTTSFALIAIFVRVLLRKCNCSRKSKTD